MAVQWNWNDKVGEAVIRQTWEGKSDDIEVSLYQGNAFLIFLNEYIEDGKEMYNVHSFFIDEAHAKNCLGLIKGHTNIFDEEHCRLVKIRLNKSRYTYTKKLVDMLIKAFDNITIEIVSDEILEV